MRLYVATAALLLAASVSANTVQAIFCNDAILDPDEGETDLSRLYGCPMPDPFKDTDTCKVATLTLGTCLVIPDYNAKGDINSCGGLPTPALATTTKCTFYEGDQCDGTASEVHDGQWTLTPKVKTTIYRSVLCKSM